MILMSVRPLILSAGRAPMHIKPLIVCGATELRKPAGTPNNFRRGRSLIRSFFLSRRRTSAWHIGRSA